MSLWSIAELSPRLPTSRLSCSSYSLCGVKTKWKAELTASRWVGSSCGIFRDGPTNQRSFAATFQITSKSPHSLLCSAALLQQVPCEWCYGMCSQTRSLTYTSHMCLSLTISTDSCSWGWLLPRRSAHKQTSCHHCVLFTCWTWCGGGSPSRCAPLILGTKQRRDEVSGDYISAARLRLHTHTHTHTLALGSFEEHLSLLDSRRHTPTR